MGEKKKRNWSPAFDLKDFCRKKIQPQPLIIMKSPFIKIILCMPILFVACIEFISPNVTGISIPLQSPPDSLFTNRKIIDFRWAANELVEVYHFQLFKAESRQEYLLLDTFLSENKIHFSLEEGCYSWQVQAKNTASESPFQSHDLCIDNSPPVLPQAIYPLAGDTIFQIQPPVELHWQSADKVGERVMNVRDSLYVYQWINDWPVLLKSFEIGRDTEKSIDLTKALEGIRELKIGEYRWEVKSFDQVGYSSCSRLFNFFLQ